MDKEKRKFWNLNLGNIAGFFYLSMGISNETVL